MKIIKPSKLKAGDKVGIISLSAPIPDNFINGFKAGIQRFKELDLKVVLGQNVYKRYGGYMAGTINERVKDLHIMLRNPQIKAIFVSLGGFCINQLLPHIDFSLIKKNPKIILGFSDMTVLLNAVYKKTGLITFHGPNVVSGIARWRKFTKAYFLKAIFEHKPIGKIYGLGSFNVIREGRASGRLIGGNLSVLRTLIGTPYEPDWKNKILFLEDFKITTEDLDHLLTHLKLCGIFNKINGMIIGKLSKIKKIDWGSESEWKGLRFFSPEKIILEITKEHEFPIISNIDFGHHREQITIPIGVKAEINTFKKLFSINESGVK